MKSREAGLKKVARTRVFKLGRSTGGGSAGGGNGRGG